MQWWCSARDVAWAWTWQPYPGVWLFLTLLIAAYLRIRRAGGQGGGQPRGRAAAFTAGLVLLWVALDWPVGALGAGYLASVHMVQFLLIALAAPPLLLLGVPREAGARARMAPPLARATHPLLALLVFNAVVIATHLPVVTDTLMRSQPGSFAVDTLWLAAGLLYWWPVVVGAPERPGFSPPVQMGYLFVSMVFMTAPGVMITFSDLPIYGIYELAPPMGVLSPIDDQRIAGVLMKLGAGVILWTAIGILFVRWKQEEDRLLARDMARIETPPPAALATTDRNALDPAARDVAQRTPATAGE